MSKLLYEMESIAIQLEAFEINKVPIRTFKLLLSYAQDQEKRLEPQKNSNETQKLAESNLKKGDLNGKAETSKG